MNEIGGSVERHVLEYVGKEQGVVSPDGCIWRGREGLDRVGGATTLSGNVNRCLARVDPHSVSIEMQQVPSNAATHVKNVSGLESTDIPPIRRLNIQQAFPSSALHAF
jgi:hypothetical protein